MAGFWRRWGLIQFSTRPETQQQQNIETPPHPHPAFTRTGDNSLDLGRRSKLMNLRRQNCQLSTSENFPQNVAAGIIWTHSLSIIRNINLSAFNLVRVTAWNLFRSDKVKTHFILRSVPIRINCTINSNSRQCCYEEQKKCRKSLSG